MDIVNHLAPEGITEKLPRVSPGYAELVIRMRQVGEDREDLQLAEWFSGAPIAPGEDDVFDRVAGTALATSTATPATQRERAIHEGSAQPMSTDRTKELRKHILEANDSRTYTSKHVHFVRWDSADELRTRLIDVLVRELKLKGPDDIAGFDATLGGVEWNGLRFYNYRTAKGPGAAEVAESWQILSPVRSGAHGVPDLNRIIHERFRQEIISASYEVGHQYPKPKGPEKIVYGDKVINLANTDPSFL